MSTRPVTIRDLWKGASSKSDIDKNDGHLRESYNLRHVFGFGAEIRSGTDLVTDLDGRTVIPIGFSSGDRRVKPGDTVVGKVSGAGGTLKEVRETSGDYLSGDMIGSLDVILSTGTFSDGEILQVSSKDMCVIDVIGSSVLYADLDYADDYVVKQLDDNSIYINTSGITVIKGDGTEGTIQFEALLDFSSGDLEIDVGDTIKDSSNNVVGVATGVTLLSGSWAANDGYGVLRYRRTSSVDFVLGDNVTLDGSTAAVVANGSSDVMDYTYLGLSGATIADLDAIVRQDSVICYNAEVEIDTESSPYTQSVSKEVIDFNKLLKHDRDAAKVYKTIQSTPGYPAGFYYCTVAVDVSEDELGEFVRIPKPNQDDALYDEDTVPHRLLRIDASTWMWQSIPYDPRLSGGDVEGQSTTGIDIIRNKALLKGRKVKALEMIFGRMVFLLDDKSILLSVAAQFFNLWQNDILELVPSDRILHDITAENAGDVVFAQSGKQALFIQMEHKQVQYTAHGQTLSAGGGDTVYNGFDEVIGEYESSATISPVAAAGFLVFCDANQHLHLYAEAEGGFFHTTPDITDEIIDDLNEYTLTELAINNRTIYAIADDGTAWIYQMFMLGTDQRQGSLSSVGAWSRLEIDGHEVVTAWGYGNVTKLVTREESAKYAIMNFRDVVHDVGDVPFEPRLDRRETLQGIYNPLTGLTCFYLSDTVGDATKLALKADESAGGKAGQIINTHEDSSGQLAVFDGDFSDEEHYVGQALTGRGRLPDLWLGADVPRVLVVRLASFHDRTTNYTLRVSRPGRDDASSHFASKITGVFKTGSDDLLDTGTHEIRIGGAGKNVGVYFESDSGGQFRMNKFTIAYERDRL